MSTNPESGCYNPNTDCCEIWTVNQFKDLRTASTSNRTFRLMANLNLGETNWIPLPSFLGYFQGFGHTIEGFEIHGEGPGGWGLWSHLHLLGKIESLKVRGIVSANSTDDQGVGLLVGFNQGNIICCETLSYYNDLSVDANGFGSGFEVIGINGNWNTGGLVGYTSFGSIESCVNRATVFGNHIVGGIAGSCVGSKIEFCRNSFATIGGFMLSDTSEFAIGGIVGYFNYNSGTGCIRSCTTDSAMIKLYNQSSSSRELSPLWELSQGI